MDTQPLLAARGIKKAYPGVQALGGVDLEVRPGEVHALVGENGAGKTTLMFILSGVVRPDAGRLFLEGRELHLTEPLGARRLGISTVFQELSLVPTLSLAENVFANRQPTRFGLIDRPKMEAEASALLGRLGISLDPRVLVRDLSFANQQLVEIAKALSLPTKLLLLDEPTSALTPKEVGSLLELVRNLRASGVSVIYITHKLAEVLKVSDRITVLRDGLGVGTIETGKAREEDIISMMVGRTLSTLYPEKAEQAGELVFQVEGFSRPPDFREVSLEIRQGEIVGLAGLVGAGRSELARAIFGVERKAAGRAWLEGQEVRVSSPQQAISLGMAYLPEDRRTDGLFLRMSVAANIISGRLGEFSRLGLMDNRLIRTAAEQRAQQLDIRAANVDQLVSQLSGGTQQKVLLAKWLLTRPKVIIADEPTRGIDVGAKAEIHHLLRQLASQGVAILLISSELPEILGMSDRIYVMHQGRITGELSAEQASEESIMACAMGRGQRG
jgi:ribose transport system ATP-binding protein